MLTIQFNFFVYVCVCVFYYLIQSLFRMILNVEKMFVIDKFFYLCGAERNVLIKITQIADYQHFNN